MVFEWPSVNLQTASASARENCLSNWRYGPRGEASGINDYRAETDEMGAQVGPFVSAEIR